MRSLLGLTLFLIGLTVPLLTSAVAPFVAVYELSQGIITFGTMERSLELTADGGYRFTSRTRTSGFVALLRSDTVTEMSRGHLIGSQFVPASYAYDNSHKHKHYTLSFDYAVGRVLRTDQGGWTAPLPENVQDKLSYQIQMMSDLAVQRAPLRYNIADDGKLKDYQFVSIGSEEISTAAGRYHTLKLERGSTESGRRTTVWCAAELAWLPVKVEYREKDSSVTNVLLQSVRTP